MTTSPLKVEDSRAQFEYEAGQALCLPTSIIELARKGEGYDHAFDSMNIMQPLNGWWAWWKKSRAAIVVELPEVIGGCMSAGDIRTGITQTAHRIRAAGITVKGD
ncbi:hypothetical protein [Buttiauxella gaviniae]|uniref:hypothetical protein n=1 Tax=Buttiauxella gaviniae TaxID=82990 RepID=UPI003C709256